MSEKKITKAQRFEDILSMLHGEPTKYGTDMNAAEAFIAHEVDLLKKKNSADRKETPAQKANRELQEKIVAFLTDNNTGKTATEIKAGVPELQGDGISLNKVVGLLRGITVNPDKPDATADYPLRKETVKGKTLFYAVEV